MEEYQDLHRQINFLISGGVGIRLFMCLLMCVPVSFYYNYNDDYYMLTIAEHIYLHFLLTTIKGVFVCFKVISVWFLFEVVLIDGLFFFWFKFDDAFVKKSIIMKK